MTVESAIEKFRAAAIAKGDFAEGSRDKELHKSMAQAIDFLNRSGEAGRLALRSLLDDESGHVRAWVAAQLLSEDDETALPVLKQIAQSSGLLALDAQITIEEYEAGLLRSPFSENVD